MRFSLTVILGLVAAAVLAASALAVPQPGQMVNADDRNGGATTPGPHCHFVLPAGGNASPFTIVTAAIHEAHVRTGLPTGVFEATACP